MTERWRGRIKRNFTGQPLYGIVTLILLALSLMFPGIVYSSTCSCGFVDGQPSIASTPNLIDIDGDMSDWGFFIADDDNNACDGPATNPNPPPDPWLDRDSQPVSEGRDLVQFTWTYNQTYLYLYTARSDSSNNNNINKFVYYADTDNNGLMETGEPVIGAVWRGSNRNVDVSIGTYVAFAPSGDAMVDSLGFGDGYSMPGTVDNKSIFDIGSGAWGSTDGLSMEFAIEWVHLGIAPGTGHSIHVSSANANLQQPSLPAQIDDNIGGCGGGAATTQYADMDFSGAYSLQGAQASTVYGLHHLVNLGNGDDSFSFAYTITGPHSPSVVLYVDDGSSPGIFDTGDSVIAGTVAVASGASVDIIIVYGIGPTALGIATVTTTATSEFSLTQSGNVSDSVVDTVEVLVPDLLTIKSVSGVADARAFNSSNSKAIPGASVTYSIQISNVGNGWTVTDSVVVADTIPAGTEMYVGDGSSSPVTWSGVGSGLTYGFVDLGDAGDDIAFTSESSPSPAYSYTPTGDADWYDSAVTGFRINPKGAMNPSSSFTLGPRIRVR